MRGRLIDFRRAYAVQCMDPRHSPDRQPGMTAAHGAGSGPAPLDLRDRSTGSVTL